MMNPSLQVAGKTSDACTLQSIEAEKRLFVATYHGDNMKPKISDGDVIYFCPQDDLVEKPHAFDPRGHSGADPVKTFSSDP